MIVNSSVAGSGAKKIEGKREAEPISPTSLTLVKEIASTTGWVSAGPNRRIWRRVSKLAYTATMFWVGTFFGWWYALHWWREGVDLGGELILFAPVMFSLLLSALTVVTFVWLLVWIVEFTRVWASQAKAIRKDSELVRAAASSAGSAASAQGKAGEKGADEGERTAAGTKLRVEGIARWVGRPEQSSWGGAWAAAACALVLMVPLLVVAAMKFWVTSEVYVYPGLSTAPSPLSGLEAVLLAVLAVAAMALWAVLYRLKYKEREREVERTWRLARASAEHASFLASYDDWCLREEPRIQN